LSFAQPLWLIGPLFFLLGAVVGSFLATILVRWPRGDSALAGRSACDNCGVPLGAAQLVPILSYLWLKGRCRRCGARIDERHFAIELAAALVALVSVIAHPLPLAFATVLLGWWLLLLAALDREHQWLPDLLTLPLIPIGLFMAWLGLGPPLEERLFGAAIGLASLVLIAFLYRRLRGRDGMGGGDPKLFCAIGAWVGNCPTSCSARVYSVWPRRP
jgi:leader peptidase (prepilin peptidase)/N-methyltransferase